MPLLRGIRSGARGRARCLSRGEQGAAATAAVEGADAAGAQSAHAGADDSAIVRVRHAKWTADGAAQTSCERSTAPRSARTADGLPTFPELFEVDELGHLVVGEAGDYGPRKVGRRGLWLPTFHALRHGAAMDCDDAEEARYLLRHRNSNVTRAIYALTSTIAGARARGERSRPVRMRGLRRSSATAWRTR
jgi:hypothetical protein